jgi:hypothetical protein
VKPVEPKSISGYRRVVYAENQPQYVPLPAYQGPHPEHEVVTEWELTEDELGQLVHGGRVRLRLWTFGHPLQPVKLEVID